MTYEEQLKHPRWYARRDEILERDDYCCQDCLRSPNRISRHIKLQVHHRKYIDGLMAWEYPDHLLITLCYECHSKYHGHTVDLRSDRLKPTFVYNEMHFESRPVMHIRDVMIEWINTLRNAK